eukprot:9498446-Karenia_brevis.AAC.1
MGEHFEARANEYLASSPQVSKWCWDNVRPPTWHDMKVTMRRLADTHTSPGLHGLPYVAWHESGDAAVTTLSEIKWYVLEGGQLPEEEYMIKTILAPKALDNAIDVGVVCPPEDVRPL